MLFHIFTFPLLLLLDPVRVHEAAFRVGRDAELAGQLDLVADLYEAAVVVSDLQIVFLVAALKFLDLVRSAALHNVRHKAFFAVGGRGQRHTAIYGTAADVRAKYASAVLQISR